MMSSGAWGADFDAFQQDSGKSTLLLTGAAQLVLEDLPSRSVDTIITSPPYWGQREYDVEGIGLERSRDEYIDGLLTVFSQLHRLLKDEGSFWLNLGDTYQQKGLAGIPWRVALRMTDDQGWILRNEIVWNKLKGGMDQAADRLANTHELMFHFVKSKRYFYDLDSIRTPPRASRVVGGRVISATGVSGVKYRRQIELSTSLTLDEKASALAALDEMLRRVRDGEYSDFRMVIRGQQRSTHSDQARVSGRAKELNDKGFFFLRYHPKGSKPSDVWDIIPEDTQSRGASHFAAYPVDLCRIPILSTCPPDGIVLDPFVGSGTTLVAAAALGRRSVGVDISPRYIELSAERVSTVD